jgi:hypothetical protein
MDRVTIHWLVRRWRGTGVRLLFAVSVFAGVTTGASLVAQPPAWVVPQFGGPRAGGFVQAPGGLNTGIRGPLQPGTGNPWMGNPATPGNEGQALVDLIYRHVTPSHWAPAGGPGAVYYWRPRRALIVRANDEAHQGISDLLRQLRQAGQ